MDFADQMIIRISNLNQRLDQIARLINWNIFESSLRSIFPSADGRPRYCTLMLFKALLLKAWYNLSDYGLEEALDNRLSFRRFVGLSTGEKAPDHATICRFGEKLTQLNLCDRLFGCLHELLLVKGLIVKKGTLVDATFVKATVKRPDQ